MINSIELFLPLGAVIQDKTGVELLATANRGSHPANMRIRWKDLEIKQANFVGFMFNSREKMLMPCCDLVHWNNITIVIGLPSMIIASSTGLSTLSLYRKSDEDTGFYQVTWFEEKALLLGIYEGGIFSLNDSGKVLWHIEKAWNDVFVSVDKEELRFMGYDEACFSVNKVTGQRRLLES